MATDRKADRHRPGRWHSISARLGDEDWEGLENGRKALGMTRRAAIIAAIRDWVSRQDATTTPDQKEQDR